MQDYIINVRHQWELGSPHPENSQEAIGHNGIMDDAVG